MSFTASDKRAGKLCYKTTTNDKEANNHSTIMSPTSSSSTEEKKSINRLGTTSTRLREQKMVESMRLVHGESTKGNSIVKSSSRIGRDEQQRQKAVQHPHPRALKDSLSSNTMLSPSSSPPSTIKMKLKSHSKSFTVVTPNSSQHHISSAKASDKCAESLYSRLNSSSIVKHQNNLILASVSKKKAPDGHIEESVNRMDIMEEKNRQNETMVKSLNNSLVGEEVSENEYNSSINNDVSSSSEYSSYDDLLDTLNSLSVIDHSKSNNIIPLSSPNNIHYKETSRVNESYDSITPHHERIILPLHEHEDVAKLSFRKSCIDPVALRLLNDSTDTQEYIVEKDRTHSRSVSLESCSPVCSVSSSGVRYISDSLMDVKSEDEVALLYRPIALSPKYI
jgi:hypothetical protein